MARSQTITAPHPVHPDEPFDAFARHMTDPLTAATLAVQSTALHAAQQFLHDEGLLQMLPVMLSPVTDPLNHPVHEAAVAPYGQSLQVTKSMILHKQAAMLIDSPGVYVVSPNVRLEMDACATSGRHLFEFSQIDMEIAGATKEDFIDMCERLIQHLIAEVIAHCGPQLALLGRRLTVPTRPFARHESKELEKRGAAWEHDTSMEASQPFWVLDLAREFYDREDPVRAGYYHNYDLVWPEGFGEALSGAERDFDHDVLLRKIHARGQDPADFGPYMELAKRGLLKPSAGGGLGVERLVRYLTGAKHVADATLFPRVPGQAVFI